MRSSDLHSPPVLSGSALRGAIRESVRACLDLERYQLFIFGSEASGVADRRSDIDIGILGPQPVPGAVMQRIRQDLDTLRTLRSFDVVDLSIVDESFRAEALEHAERL
jgi:predicted nucleotidyltransferase